MTTRLIKLGFLTVLTALLAAPGASAQDSPASPPSEGIAVHGHWTVAVIRDGEVVERREFENALQVAGQSHITDLLARTRSPGPWTILIQAEEAGTLCAGNEFNITDRDCTISEADGELTVTDNGGTALLEGSDTVLRDGNLETVHTFQHWCGADVPPAACQAGVSNRSQFTLKFLAQPIAVQAGDTIEVTVELSFS